jgi:hypothetical protein
MTSFKSSPLLWLSWTIAATFLVTTAFAFSPSLLQQSPTLHARRPHAISSTNRFVHRPSTTTRLLSTCVQLGSNVVVRHAVEAQVSLVRQQLAGVASAAALRTAIRTIAGVSLTALYASIDAVSGVWIRQATRLILSIFPSWARLFVQPFLVLYYVPLFLLRSFFSRKVMHENSAAHGWTTA